MVRRGARAATAVAAAAALVGVAGCGERAVSAGQADDAMRSTVRGLYKALDGEPDYNPGTTKGSAGACRRKGDARTFYSLTFYPRREAGSKVLADARQRLEDKGYDVQATAPTTQGTLTGTRFEFSDDRVLGAVTYWKVGQVTVSGETRCFPTTLD